jgi:predicted outer membrane repeat protein
MKRLLRIMMLLAAMIITAGQPAWAKDITINLGEGRGTVTFSEASLEFSKCEALEVGFSFDIPLEVMTQSKTYGGVVMQNYTATLDNGVTIDGTLTGEIAAAASQTYTYTVTNNEMTRRPVSVSMTRGDSNDNDPTVEIATWSGFRKGACSFTFDDGAPSHVSDAGPLFKKYGYKATFNLVVNWNPNWSGFQGLADEGHEIASHSNSHGNNMSGEEASSKNNIKAKISQKYGVITVAYPNCNVPNESAVLQNYIVGRICNGSWQGMSDNMGKDGPSNWAKVPAIMTGSEGQLKSTNDFTSQMQKVVQSNGWVAFLTHGFQGKSNGNATYSPTDINAIDGALKWAQQNDKDIWVAPMGHVAMYIKERKASKVEITASTASLMTIQLKHTIADNISKYDYPLSLRVKSNWEKVEVTQGDNKLKSKIDGGYIYFDAIPNGGDIVVINEDASKINYEHHAGDGGLLICYANADDASADNWGNTIKCVQDANNHDKYTYYPTSSTLTDGIVYIVAQPDFGYTGLGATITAEKTTGSGNAQARLRAPGVGQTIAVTAVSGHPGVYQFTMPTDGSNVTLSAKFNTLSTNTAAINYLDEKGASKTKNKGTVYVLDGTEYNLGVANGETWYVANGELSYGHTLSLYGDVHLILADGAKMNVTTVNDYDAITYGSVTIATTLSIYAQSKGSSMGSLSAACTYPGNTPLGNGIEAGSITINGGKVSATGKWGLCAGDVIINGGIVTARTMADNGIAIEAGNKVTINGGQVKAVIYDGDDEDPYIIYGVNGITLGWTSADDYILAGSYEVSDNEGAAVTIAEGKRFVAYTAQTGTDATGIIASGTVTDFGTIGGMTLRPLAVTVTASDGTKTYEPGYCIANKAASVKFLDAEQEIKAPDFTITTGEGASAVTTPYYIYKKDDFVNVDVKDFGQDEVEYISELDDFIPDSEGDFTMPDHDITLTGMRYFLNDVEYMDWDSTTKKLVKKYTGDLSPKPRVYILTGDEVGTEIISQMSGWYYVPRSVTYAGGLKLTGDTHLILGDNATLMVGNSPQAYLDDTYNIGIYALDYFTIYGQEKGTGTLNVNADDNYHAIWCNYKNLTFNGGKIVATSDDNYCINSSDTNITINGGEVTAKSNMYNAIDANNVTINGGTVNAEGYDGINANGILSITGGTVEAIGISNGIWANGDITISGGKVTATGGTGSGFAGIYSGGGTIHLGYTDADDYIFASSYSGTVKVANGKVFQYTDDDTVYKLFPGTLDAEQKTAIGGKKLTALMVSSFAQLNTLINESTATTITLDKDYTYIGGDDEVYKDGIVINRDLTIIGDEHTIDGRSIARIFHVTDDATLTIKKAVLTEGYAEKGGGIFVDEGATLNADYVNFTDNTAVYRGGAIYSEGTVIVDHSVFEKNDITFRTKNDDNGGAAIYNMKGSLTITNTDITNNVKNIVPRDGNAGDLLVGVVATCGETSITDSQFTNNAGAWGGAISSLGYMNDDAYTLTVTNTKFKENSANFGSAIFVESSELVVDNCTFEYNCCVGKGSSGSPNTQGGAIIVMPSSSKATITNSTFTGNSANTGGAVSLAGVDQNSLIDNCTFTDNIATSEGGALYLWTQGDAAVTVKDSKFSGNTAPWGNAISNDGDLILSNNTVSSTSADIGNYYGSILSKINVDILENKTIDFYGEILITAKVTDDNKNLIKDINFDYDIKGTTGSSETVHAVFESGLYKGTFTTDVPDVYVVNMTYPVTDNLVVKTATLRNMRGDETAILFAENTTNLWATFCDIYERNLPEGCTAYTVSSVSGTTVNLSEALATIPAYTPVLIKRSTAGADAVTAAYSAPGTVPASDYDDETGIVTFAATGGTVYGNAGKTAVTDSEANHFISDQTYVLFNGKFVKVGTNSGLAAHRLWLNVSSAAARELIIGDDATGIASMDDAGSQNADGWYGLDGRKLDKAPKKKGVYVNSGRKVVIK